MLVHDVPILATSFLTKHSHELTALLSLVLAVAIAWLVDRAVFRRGRRLARAVVGSELTAVVDTRLRFLRRLVMLVILTVGIMIAISQFAGLNRLATGVLASSALLAAVVGFAARQTLANLIAGVMLTVAQPLRIGDSVTIEDASGTVEDVQLNYTVVRGGDGGRIYIPNERLAGGVLRNDSIVEPLVALEVALWLPHAVDSDQVLAALAALEQPPVVRVAEITPDGVHYTVARGRVTPAERLASASALRADALRALRAEGLLAPFATA
ncbi:MAG: MscS Mechanosensitive ion channel [Conexibacter sp.]|nr:MscS Mechanosensitive ion channel [Conexibacter sp.]